MIVDYHMHLRDPEERIDHTVEGIERFVETAAARGVDEIGFTEHVYYFRQTFELWTSRLPDRALRVRPRRIRRTQWSRRSGRGCRSSSAMEVDYVGPRQDELAEILAPYPWDYLLGSVHWIDGRSIDAAPDRGMWAEHPVDEVWRRYFAALAELAALRPRRRPRASRPDEDLRPPPRGRGSSIPSCPGSPWRSRRTAATSPSASCIPTPSSWPPPACRSRSPRTRTSPQNVGRDLDRALDLAREAGYETVTVFDEP